MGYPAKGQQRLIPENRGPANGLAIAPDVSPVFGADRQSIYFASLRPCESTVDFARIGVPVSLVGHQPLGEPEQTCRYAPPEWQSQRD